MARLPKYNSTRLFHKLARASKNDWIKKNGRKPTVKEWNQIQKWTSQNLYPQYKGTSVNKVLVRDINKSIKSLGVPTVVIKCGDARKVPKADYALIDWWDVSLSLQRMNPDVQVRVNAGEFGMTPIEKSGFINNSGQVNKIIDNVREYANNQSGPYYEGFIKLVPGKRKNNNPCSYFLDLVLFNINGEPIGDMAGEEVIVAELTQAERDQEKRRKKAIEKKIKAIPTKKSKVKKLPRQLPKEKPKVKTQEQSILELIKLFEKNYQEGLISQKEYSAYISKLMKRLK